MKPKSLRTRTTSQMRHWLQCLLQGLPWSKDKRSKLPQRTQPPSFHPTVRTLEPRFVLNATAELTAIGQLLLTGDGAADTLTFSELPDGDILITDDTGNIIPIANHPGDDSDPLPVSAITSGEVRIDLGDGDDQLNLQLPGGLDVTLTDGGGTDRVDLSFSDRVAASPENTILIAAETITIGLGDTTVSLTNDDVLLTGHVFIGNPTSTTNVDLGTGDLEVVGFLQLGGDVSLFSIGGSVDWSAATLTANQPGADVLFRLSHPTDADLILGGVDDTGGARIENLSVIAASSVQLKGDIDLTGGLTSQGVLTTTTIDAAVTADSVQLRSSDALTINGDVAANESVVFLQSNQSVIVRGMIDTTAAGIAGDLSLVGSDLQLESATLITSNADVSLIGTTRINDLVSIETGNAGSAGSIVNGGGDIQFFGTVSGTDSIGDQLRLNATGPNGSLGGVVLVQGDIGNPNGSSGRFDLNNLAINADAIDLRSVGISGGTLQLTANTIRMSGPQWIVRASTPVPGTSPSTLPNDILIDGQLSLPNGDARIESDRDVLITSPVAGAAGTEALRIDAQRDVRLESTISQFDDLVIQAGGKATILDDITLQGDLDVAAAAGVDILAAQITADQQTVFRSEVTFQSVTTLAGTSIRFDDTVVVVDGATATTASELADPLAGRAFTKSGGGTLVLAAETRFTAETLVQAGTLQVDSLITDTAGTITIGNGATLSGDGPIQTDIDILAGGRLAPSQGASGPTSALVTGSIQIRSGGVYEVQLNGVLPGTQHAQILVGASSASNESVSIEGAILDLQVNFALPPASEFVVIQNDGTEPVDGRFQVNFDTNGNPTTQRTLNEGDIVLAQMGGQAAAAVITYFGGDGNDVAIVTAGDVNFMADQISLIQRRGVDLEIRTGQDFAAVQAASPIVRPIAGLNSNRLILTDTPGDDVLLIDIDGLVDPTSGALSFTGKIDFQGNPSFTDNDRVVLFDSDPTTNDIPSNLSYTIDDNRAGRIDVDVNGSLFAISFSGLERFEQLVTADNAQLTYALPDQNVTVNADSLLTSNTVLDAASGSTAMTQISLSNPRTSLTLWGGNGNDQFVVSGFGSSNGDFDASLTIDGQTGNDTIFLATDLEIGSSVSTGDLTLVAETTSLQGDVETIDGDIRITGGSSVRVVNNSVLRTGEGVIAIDGNGGLIDVGSGDLISQADQNAITIVDATSVVLGDVAATNGQLVIGENANVTGAVSQAPQTFINVDQLGVSTTNTVDLSADNNRITRVDQIQSDGNIIVVDATDDLVVAGVNSDAADVTIRAQGSIALQDAAVLAETATVSISAGQAIVDFDGNDSGSNIIAGTVNLQAGRQGIGDANNALDVAATLETNATTGISNGDIYLANLDHPFLVGRIDAGQGSITLTADSINDANQDELTDLIATDLTLLAESGIGTNERLELQNVDTLVALTNEGGIDLQWTANRATLIQQASTNGGDIQITQIGNQRLEIGSITNATGAIQIINQDASIDVIGNGIDDVAIQTGQAGTVSLTASGNSADVFLRSGISTDAGAVSIQADRNTVFSATGDITSTSGDLRVVADARTGNFAGSIAMIDGALLDQGSGTISLIADGQIGLAGLVTNNAGDDAVVISTASGQITDRGDTNIDIHAALGTTRLTSQAGIGAGNAVETNLGILDSHVTGTGATEISETDQITLRSVQTMDGLIDVVAGGTITAIQVLSQNESGSDDGTQLAGQNSRDIQLTANGSGSDILVDQITAQETADVILIAQDDVLDRDLADQRRVTGDDLRVRASNTLADNDATIQLSTAVNDADLIALGSNRGDIDLREAGSINLAASDADLDSETITTSNGEIRISASQSIRVADLMRVDDSEDLLSDREIIAGGDNGRIIFFAADSLELGDAVQLSASQSTIDAVRLESTDVILGEQIQISTGQNIGVARFFAPRPEARLIDTAFYEPTSVSTNILEQAAVNDAEGELTVDVGNEGERGLTINLDWGAETNRFQQIDGLSGDAPPLIVSHIYLEEDILDSRLNGRVSETASLNVKFSVRHHESIRVIGDTINQGDSDTLSVDGRVLSSSDNPLTAQSEQIAILENGTASFIIPALSIPVAFFPVRDVIPELTDPEVFVQVDQSVSLSQSSFATVESSVTTSVARQEYFQIRVLSPDPDGDDLAAPEQLPENILDGDQLRNLFGRLPDGRYEIEYVLGDGNERTILQVDLRGGRPIISNDDLDGGTLRLLDVTDQQDGQTEGDALENSASENEANSSDDPESDNAAPAENVEQQEIERIRERLQQQGRHSNALNPIAIDAVQTPGPVQESFDLNHGNANEWTKMNSPELAAAFLGVTTAGHQAANYFSAGKRFRRRSRNAG